MDKHEIHRLKKALKDDNMNKVIDWANQYEAQVNEKYRKIYKDMLDDSLNVYEIALAYTICLSEEVKHSIISVPDFLEDFFVTVNMFNTGEYDPEDYTKQLADEGINIDEDIKKFRDKHPKGDLDVRDNV